MLASYLEIISLTERLHRQFLDVLKAELDAMGLQDINNVQALILFNIGSDELTVGELTQRGYYLGSNVSYNLKKMVEAGYVKHARSAHDRRTVRIALSAKGKALWSRLDSMFGRQAGELDDRLTPAAVAAANGTLKDIERFWEETRLSAMRTTAPPLRGTASLPAAE